MFDLFLSEFKRFRLMALIAFFLQILCWIVIGKMMIILEPIYFKHVILMLCALSAGMGVGAVQMLLHKRKNHWTYLIHRPMSMSKIHLAISAAAVCIILLGFILPFATVLVYLDVMTNNVVDIRHYLMSLDMLLIAITAYFITSYVVLSPSKLVLLSLWMLTYLTMRNSVEAVYMLLSAAIFCGLSFYMAHRAFKIDLSTFSNKKPMIVLMSITLQPLLFVLIVMSQSIYYHLPLGLLSAHPSRDLSIDSYFSFTQQDTKQQFEALLSDSKKTSAARLHRQISLAQYKSFSLRQRTEVTKGQLFTSDRSFNLWDEEQNLWVFSHDKMVFEGRHSRTDNIVGYLTNAGFVSNLADILPQQRFAFVPNLISSQYIYTQNKFFAVNFSEQTITQVHQLAGDEVFAGSPVSAFDLTLLRTNQHLLMFNQTDFSNAQNVIEPLHKLTLPTALENRMHVEVSQMTDGYLFMFNSAHFFGFEKAGSELVYITHDNEITSLAQKRFDVYHYPRLLTEQYFTISPIVANGLDFTLGRLFSTSKTTPDSVKYFWQRDYPIYIWWFCIAMASVSALITLVLVKRLPMTNSNRWLWVALSLIGALPGLIAFLILNDWRSALRNSRHVEKTHV